MSEEEKIKRAEYQRKRTIWKRIGAAAIIVVTLLAIAFSFVYYTLNKTYYISYAEEGSVDYKVYLKENDFFEDDVLPGGSAYVASLIDKVEADFKYKLAMDAESVDYEYVYKIDTQLLIKDPTSGISLFAPVYDTVPEVKVTKNDSSSLSINEKITIDYEQYNSLAEKFIDTYDLTGAVSSLNVKMHISVLSLCEDFEEDNSSEYVVSLIVPLTKKTVNVEMSTAVPATENKILACDRALNKDLFLIPAIALSGLDVILIIAFVLFVYLTRNTHINYSLKVKRLVAAYRSFIQKINNRFDTTGYQVLLVDTFNEMLEIRDTINSPILMNENEDQTCTSFYIPTNTKLLYVYNIKVDNYDKLYGTYTEEPENKSEPDAEPLPQEPKPEPAAEPKPTESEKVEAKAEPAAEPEPAEDEKAEAKAEPVAEPEPAEDEKAEAKAEPVAEPEPADDEKVEAKAEPAAEPEPAEDEKAEAKAEPVAEPKPEVIITEGGEDSGAAEEGVRLVNGEIVHVRYRTSFMSRLIQSGEAIQDYYTAVKNALLSYKGVKARSSWAFESFNKGRLQCAKLNVKGSSLHVYLALDPDEYNADKYRFTNVKDKPKLGAVPMLLKVKSERSLKYALELIAEVMKKNEIPMGEPQNEGYRMPYETTEELVSRDLVKVIFPDGITIDENTVIQKLNVNELMKTIKSEDED
ncbi:MAG: hypothetical protein IJY18_01660 [Clostridia bacterium]|nr:hypothetical protein [Clostridia bacterium]